MSIPGRLTPCPRPRSLVTRAASLGWITLSILFTGCGRSPDRLQVSTDERGRHLIVHASRLPMTGEGAPRLTLLGEIDGSDFPFDPPLWRIGGIGSDDDGHLFIGDRGHGHVVITDMEGHYLGKIGSKGPGPFEFRNVSVFDLKPEWIPSLRLLAVVDGIWKVVFFEPDGTPSTRRVTYEQFARRMMDCAPMENGLAAILRSDPPITLLDVEQGTVARIGRLLEPEDAAWPRVAEAIEAEDITEYQGAPFVGNARLPLNIGTAGDTLAIHDFGLLTMRNGYRAWDLRSGEWRWQIDIDVGDWEPPTTYNYTTSGSNEMISWDRDVPQVQANTFIAGISGVDGLIFVVTYMRGDGTRFEPDHHQVVDPQAVNEDDALGLQGQPFRGAIEVLTDEPDLLAHIKFPLRTYITQAWVARGPLLILGYDDPEPHLVLYRIEGLRGGLTRQE